MASVELRCTAALRPDLIYGPEILLLAQNKGLWDGLFSCICKLELVRVGILHNKHIFINTVLFKNTRCRLACKDMLLKSGDETLKLKEFFNVLHNVVASSARVVPGEKRSALP